MTDALFGLVTQYGGIILFVATFLSCLAAPIPTSLLMLAGGAFLASSDLTFVDAFLLPWIGAVLGDQAGYILGNRGGRLSNRLMKSELVGKADKLLARRGGTAVFLSRWLFSPLGPYVNLLAGATAMNRGRFTLASILGELVWVLIYATLGLLFAANISAIADIAADLTGVASALLIAMILGIMVFRKSTPR